MNLNIAIITVSDRASNGTYKDKSGPAVKKTLAKCLHAHQISFELAIVSDEPAKLRNVLIEFVEKKFDFIFTTGGTGVGPRDITPEVTLDFVDKEIPGIGEAMRAYSMEITKNAMFSRATAGIKGRTLVINLPGSPKAVEEILNYLGDTLTHAHAMIHGIDIH